MPAQVRPHSWVRSPRRACCRAADRCGKAGSRTWHVSVSRYEVLLICGWSIYGVMIQLCRNFKFEFLRDAKDSSVSHGRKVPGRVSKGSKIDEFSIVIASFYNYFPPFSPSSIRHRLPIYILNYLISVRTRLARGPTTNPRPYAVVIYT